MSIYVMLDTSACICILNNNGICILNNNAYLYVLLKEVCS